jgi:plasmid stability protein
MQHMHNARMPSITIRDVPDAARDELAARAAASGRSLQQYLRGELIRLAEQPDNNAIFERARERVRVTGEGLTSDQILDFLDADRSGQATG